MNVTVKESIYINVPPEVVWDFTQDWTRRSEWDPAIRSVAVIPGPTRAVRAFTSAGPFLVRYKLFDRPRRTRLSMTPMAALGLIRGGDGSWEYAPAGDGTLFIQEHTLVLRVSRSAVLQRPFVAWQLRRTTRTALSRAKQLLER